MTTVLPIGYVTLLEAAEMLQLAMHAGVPGSRSAMGLRPVAEEGKRASDVLVLRHALADAGDARSPAPTAGGCSA